jgi:hypothetical protein
LELLGQTLQATTDDKHNHVGATKWGQVSCCNSKEQIIMMIIMARLTIARNPLSGASVFACCFAFNQKGCVAPMESMSMTFDRWQCVISIYMHAYQQPQTLSALKKIDVIGFLIGSQHLSSVAEVFALFLWVSQLLQNGVRYPHF